MDKYRCIIWQYFFQLRLNRLRSTKSGKIKLFGNLFFYHYGLAFYNTYNEIFKDKIYAFNTSEKEPYIIDCGANMGLSVLYFSKLYPQSKILAFEPDITVLPYLEKNIDQQNLKNVTLHKKAVWSENTKLSFYTDRGLGGRLNAEYKDQMPKQVEAIRLRDILNQPIAMLKLDIEGAEFVVLQDCEPMLKNVQNIFIEYHSIFNQEQKLDDLLNILKRNGFRYHLKESFSREQPFIDNRMVCENFDMAINVFGYRK